MNKDILIILDEIMAEYGWTLHYTISLPITVLKSLYEIICQRQRDNRIRQTENLVIGINAAFSENGLEVVRKAFRTEAEKEEAKSEEIDEVAQKAQMKALWVKMGKDPDKFEEQYSKGEVTF